MSRFLPDLDTMREVWGDAPPAHSLEDFFTVSIETGSSIARSPTHLFGDELRILPYHDLDGEDHVRDAAGERYARGDSALSEVIRPGQLAFLLYHHRPEMRPHPQHGEQSGRLIRAPLDAGQAKAHLKLVDSHAGLAVGVADRDGAPGVVTLHNPQCYPFDKGEVASKDIDPSKKKRFGRFSDPAYSMIFFAPEFPSYLDSAREAQFTANIRTMALGFNAVADYPSESYDGADPLAATDVERVREHAARMVQAIAGDDTTRAEARAWFAMPEHLIYCSEFIHLSVSAGLHVPLNAATFVPLVGEVTWRNFLGLVEAHNHGESTPFTALNKNHRARHITAEPAADDLRPLSAYAPPETRERVGAQLAFQPLTAQEIIALSLAELAPAQSPHSSAPALDLLERFSPEFVASLQAQTRAAGNSPNALFVPPTVLHFVAKGNAPKGLLDLRYLGHGIHFSMVRRR